MLKHLINLVFLLTVLSYKAIYADNHTRILPEAKPKRILNFVKENAPISTVTSAEIAEECIALTEKDLQEMVVAFDRRVAAKGYKIQKPVPQNPFGGSSSSTSTTCTSSSSSDALLT